MTRGDTDLEAIASENIGKIIFAFSQLELNINLCLQWAVGAQDFYSVNPLVERLSFKSKIDALIEVIEIKFSSSPECISDFKAWHRKLDKIRVKRNSFIHGRWGFLDASQEIVNVSPGLIGAGSLKETRYAVSALQDELVAVKDIAEELYDIRKKWHV